MCSDHACIKKLTCISAIAAVGVFAAGILIELQLLGHSVKRCVQSYEFPDGKCEVGSTGEGLIEQSVLQVFIEVAVVLVHASNGGIAS